MPCRSATIITTIWIWRPCAGSTREHRPLIVTPLGNDRSCGEHAREPVSAAGDWWDRIDIGKGGEVTIVPAYHWSACTGRDRRMALWCGFMLSTTGGRAHFTGDTGYGDGRIFREVRLRIGRPDLALIPIGAYAPRWFMSAAAHGSERSRADP